MAGDEYARRLERSRAEVERESRRSDRIADARLATFVLAGVVGAVCYFRGLSAWWLAVPLAAFAGLVVVSGILERARRRAVRAAEFYEFLLARVEERWAGQGESGARFLDETHPYAADLDLFGAGSLYERLCTARTASGQATLARWLLEPAEPEAIRERQRAVAELTPRLDLREDLALLGDEVKAVVHPDELAAWGTSPPVVSGRAPLWIARVIAAFAAASLAGWFWVGTGFLPVLAATVAQGVFTLVFRNRLRQCLSSVEQWSSELALLAELLGRLEREPFESPALAGLASFWAGPAGPSSRTIGRLLRQVDRLDLRENLFTAIPAAVLLVIHRTAFTIEAWRAAHGARIAEWLAAVGEVEALAALAAFAFENPGDPFPEVLPGGDARFEANGLGHPLIPRDRLVRNDLALGGGELRALIVSGSNMSGKSTLLRSAGINAVLAQAGGPVRAERLVMTPLAIGATLRVQDSLQAGRSRFYAEITRVRQLVELARGPRPLLFLLDEVFNGTNSHDRRIGAEAVVRRLIDQGAIGLVTTHDLALGEIADGLAPRAANVHFEDRLEGGVMTFDYTMRPGLVQHSNALALMRAVGLDV